MVWGWGLGFHVVRLKVWGSGFSLREGFVWVLQRLWSVYVRVCVCVYVMCMYVYTYVQTDVGTDGVYQSLAYSSYSALLQFN